MGDHDRGHRSRPWQTTVGDVDGGAGGRELVDWRGVSRRILLLALAWGGLAALGIVLTTALLHDVRGAGALWAGVVALGFLASALVVVALSALRGMLRAGESRERLAAPDVGLMPPQVRSRRPSKRKHRGGEGA